MNSCQGPCQALCSLGRLKCFTHAPYSIFPCYRLCVVLRPSIANNTARIRVSGLRLRDRRNRDIGYSRRLNFTTSSVKDGVKLTVGASLFGNGILDRAFEALASTPKLEWVSSMVTEPDADTAGGGITHEKKSRLQRRSPTRVMFLERIARRNPPQEGFPCNSQVIW